ncbi:WD40 repeat-like protein [Annulohypoxylon truncatum]|uniref:WD40 repeat-like protein n=1 Tax=Annulohypoxylon truncatum TaxID=327061 RepID=UPI002008A71A|nr:WD40 repeat-like protein [Annulohypoxylon truncatum]KAI1209125.1 WD40 repeat-like protein [Annulohypoxylon truncatum]
MSRELAALGRLHREHVLNPITALAFYTSTDGEKYLLAGEDTDIKVYHVQTSRFCGQLSVFSAQSIHGIAVPPADISEPSSLILVWGGHSVKILPRDVFEDLIEGGQRLTRDIAEARAPDWIFDGRVSPFGDDRILLLTAHNEVIPAHVDPSRGKLIFDKILSPSRPILYSGNFFWVSKESVLVAAGTVFGEILVWKCYLGVSEQKQDCEVLFVFTGHEGSIFGVHISPEIRTQAGENLRLLASCSDDRTIRVWDITEKHESQDPKGNGHNTHISDARETGFGNNVEASAHDNSSARCLATVMGHASRIWQVGFPQNQLLSRTSNIVGLYSFGEDATAQKWNLSLDLPLSELGVSSSPIKPVAKLTHQSTFSNHSGKHIWSHAMTSEDDDILIATGGSDGKIALIGVGLKGGSSSLTDDNPTVDKKKAIAWSLTDVLQSSQTIGATIDTKTGPNDISDNTPSPSRSTKPKNAKEAFNRYTFISDKRLLAATNSGRIFVGSFGNDLTWIELALPGEIGQVLFSHALHGTSPAYPLAFIGTSNGYIYYYSESGNRSLQSLAKVDGKVADIFWLSDASTSNKSEFQIFVAILRSTNAVIIHVNADTLTTRQISVILEPGFMVTAAVFIQGYLVLGSRKGIIAVFSQGEDGNYSVILTVEVHRDEAITSLLPLHSREDRPRKYILSTCRDGKYRIHEISTKADQSAAVLIHEALPPFVSSVEGAWLANGSDGTRDLMLCGFRSSNFVVWNESRRHEVATVDCGGSSRSYAWAPIRSQPDGFRFVFTKAGQMHVFSQTHAPHRTLKPGGHGREVKAVSASPGRYVATAAEDTVVRIWEYGNGEGEGEGEHSGLRCVAALERHATGIQALKWVGNEYLFSSGGNEEFFVWRLNTLESDDFAGLAVVCEAVFPDRSEIGDARITDFDVTCVGGDGGGAKEFRISMALSNSTLQTYTYGKEVGFRLLSRWTYTGACLTQVRHLGSSHILTAATDGYLAIYANTSQATDKDADGSPLPIVVKLHQNTIKALDIRQVASDNAGTSLEFLVVTGGDDNALGVVHICISPSSPPSLPASPPGGGAAEVTVKSKSIIRSAHAAGITGAAIAHLGGDSAVVVTGSNDQRIRVWRLAGWCGDEKEKEKEKERIRAQLLEDRYSAVADAGGLEVFERGKKAIVVGVGFEVWDLHALSDGVI